MNTTWYEEGARDDYLQYANTYGTKGYFKGRTDFLAVEYSNGEKWYYNNLDTGAEMPARSYWKVK